MILVRTAMPGRAVEPQPGPETPTDAPFFFEDPRHAFYVTTEEAHASLTRFRGFGFGRAPAPHHPGKEYSFPPILTPGSAHPPPSAHAIQYGGRRISHAGVVRHAPAHRK